MIGPEDVSADITAMNTHNQRLDALLRAAITQDEALIRAIQYDIVTNYTRDRIERRTYLKYSSILQNIAPAALWAKIVENDMAFVGTVEKASEKAWNDGVERGMERGMEQGMEQGRVQTMRASILRVASVRDITVSSNSLQRLDACRDIGQLEAWLAWVSGTDSRATELPD